MADIKNFGIKGLAADVQMGKSGGRLKYDSGNSRFDFTQSDGSTLENIRLGSVVAGSWTATAIDPAYGGLGTDVSSSTGIVTLSSGTTSVAAIDLSDANLIDSSSTLPVAQGGTGANTAVGARTNLGLGSISTQDANNVAITGGAIDGAVIGGTSTAAGSFTTVSASGGFTGDLTGNASGSAATLATARDIGLSGDASGNVSFDGSADVNLALTLATSGVTAGNYGSATQIPVLSIDAKGRVTSASNISLSTGFDIAGDNGSNDTVNGGETLSIVGTAGQTETTITNNQVAVGIVDGASIANLTVTGTFTSDDITSSAISIDGDATITGNLVVQGTQTTVNSTTVETADAIFRTNSNGANTDAGFEANTASGVKQILYTSVGSEWDFGSENVKASSFEGDLTGNVTGDVTGTVSSIANHDTDALSEGSTNLYWTTARGNAAMDAYLVGGTGIDYTSGTIDLADTAVTPGSYGNATAIPQITVDQQGRITSASTTAISTSWTLAGDSGSSTIDGGDTANVLGGTNITTSVSGDSVTVALDNDVTLSGNISAADGTFSGDVSVGNVTVGSGSGGTITGVANITASGTITGGTLTDGTASLASGNITGGVAATFSGAVTGGSLTDGTATLSSGALSGATTGAFSGNVSAGNLSVTGAVASATADFSGQVDFGSLSDGSITITGFVDEDNMVSDSDTLIPTQQSVKAYVDAQITLEDLDFAGDSGTGNVDLDSQNLTIAGGTGLTSSASGQTLTIDLDNTAVTAGNYGSATEIPTFTVDAQGRITAAANVSVSTGFDIAGDNGSNDTVSGGETLSIVGTAGQTETTITNNQVAVGIVDGASIANLTVTGTFTSDDITSSQVNVNGDAIITGNLTVQGSQTIVDSTTVQTADAIFRVNSNGTTGANVGFEANVGGSMKQIVYTPAGEWDFGAEDVQAANITASGTLTGGTLTDGTLSSTAGTITGGVAATFSGAVTGGSLTDGTATLSSGALSGATTGAFSGNVTSGGSFVGNLVGDVTGDVTAANVSFSTGLTDGTTTIASFVTESDAIASNDNDTTVPTSAAVKDYVDNNGGDGLLLRQALTSGSATIDTSAMPNVSSRTYYASKIVIKVGTAFSGGSFNHILVKENAGSGTTLVAADDADAATVGTYIIELDGDYTLTKNAAVQVQFMQADGTTAATTSSGAGTITVHYNYV